MFPSFLLQIVLLLLWVGGTYANSEDNKPLHWHGPEVGDKDVYMTHSCIHDQILHERRRPGRKEYSVTPQVYEESGLTRHQHRRGRSLLGLSSSSLLDKDVKQPIRIYLNYDAVGHSPDRDCRNVGDIVKVCL